MKSFVHQIEQLLKVLSSHERKKVSKHLFFLGVNVLFDLVSIASILPLIFMFSDEQAFSDSPYIIRLSELTGLSVDDMRIPLVICVFLFFGIKSILAYWLYQKNARLLAGISGRLSLETFRRNFGVNDPSLKGNDTGQLLQRIIEVPEAYAFESLSSFFKLFTNVLTALIIGIALIIYQPLVFLLVLAVLSPGVAAYLAIHKNRTTNIRNDIARSIPSVMQQGVQALSGRQEILISGSEDFFVDSFYQSIHKKNNAIARLMTYTQSAPKIMELIAVVGVCSLFTYLFISDTPASEALLLLSVFTAATFRLIPSMNGIILAQASIKVHDYAVKLLLQPFNKSATGPAQKPQLKEFKNNIEFKKVDFEYPTGNFRIDHLSFTISKGTKFGLVGRSGTGKSTIAKLLLRFEEESKGEVLIDGQSAKTFDLDSLWQNIAYVPPDAFIFKGTLTQNITMGRKLTSADKERLKKLIASLGLEDLIDQLAEGLDESLEEFGKSISSGQKQRIGIARAVWQDRPILIFDEVTANLDNYSKQQVLTLLNKAMTDKTALIITHDPAIVEMCDEVLDLNS